VAVVRCPAGGRRLSCHGALSRRGPAA
jgi:hypothetical protein